MAILEAFGHAPTLFNSNSTRFAKYFEMRYTANGDLISGKFQTRNKKLLIAKTH